MPSTLVQLIEGSCFGTSQHCSICPFRLAIAPWMSNRGKAYLAAKFLDILHEGAAHELCDVVGDDSVWHTKTANESLEELDGRLRCHLSY